MITVKTTEGKYFAGKEREAAISAVNKGEFKFEFDGHEIHIMDVIKNNTETTITVYVI